MRYKIQAIIAGIILPFVVALALAGGEALLRIVAAWFNYGYGTPLYSVFSGLESVGALIIVAGIPAVAGWLLARKTKLPDTFLARFCPVLTPIFVCLLASIPLVRIDKPNPLVIIIFSGFLLAVYVPYIISFAISSRLKCKSRQTLKGFLGLAVALTLLTAAAVVNMELTPNLGVEIDDYRSVGHGVDTYRYFPLRENNLLVKPDTPPALKITANHPRLDGAIAVLPVYGAVAEAVYENLDGRPYYLRDQDPQPDMVPVENVVSCRNTPRAWQALIDGEVDIFFGVPPSAAQLKKAEEAGVGIEEFPLAKDAFVFMVNTENPIEALSLEDIQKIYTRQISNWQDVGGYNSEIIAFQRPKNSGSQTTMEEVVMAGLEMAEPLREEMMVGMGDIILAVASYDNQKSALGYTFRWYATEQFPSDDIRFLAVDGINPSPQNIQSGLYPYTVTFVAVARTPISDESKTLIEWMQSDEGQALIAKTGYIPLR